MNQLLTVTFLLTFLLPASIGAAAPADEKRLDEVAERGAHVMPFDLEKTTHVFTKTESGGVQKVTVKNISDQEQVSLIRAHLSEIANEFKQGNFSSPAKIHGEGMPGLSELKAAKPGDIKIEYKVLPIGAQISYSTESPQLINAIHRWFDAQLSDHARHAEPGQPHQHMPNQ
ncbi:MAG: aspartate carbamoyltransferase [Nitrosomonas sp.]|nr:aspartate carbamoyltransferase [Nitrosomonas sp.]OQW83442.1 MAG: aspartate carbamoyltransferase [Proteobacteria bacterium ST_bin16]